MAWLGLTGSPPGDKYPVDTMVNALRDIFDSKDLIGTCISVNGQERKCCDGIRSCFVALRKAVDAAQIRGIEMQNMQKECRILDAELSASEKCVDTWTGVCDRHTNSDVISGNYQEFAGELRTTLDRHCSEQPQNVTRHADTPTDTTTQPVMTTPYLNTTVAFAPTPTGNGSHASPQGGSGGNGDNFMTAGLAVGGALLFLGVFGVILWRCRLLFKRSGLQKDFGYSMSRSENECETEIYAEIDDAFMKAVYEHDQTTDVNPRDRVPSNAQVNVCYQSGLEDGGIIPSSRRCAKNDNVEIRGQSALVRLANKKWFPLSKTSSTDACNALPADDSMGSGQYDTITDHPLPIAGQEPVYAVPKGGDGCGGTKQRSYARDAIMSPPQNHSSFPLELSAHNVYSHSVSPRNVYVNAAESNASKNKRTVKKRNEIIQNATEGSFNHNDDSMMVY
ncbi:uncharacterized protein LOC127831209 [Dreissena polymorpha]|uniref:Uncharacterized protein n=1 Tax=Dreissena polymorpha TaxID=45954 RepID=A0A9D4JSA3_DREPO|nr:uncharacterized protein LOC127831209 [Dreissena polymorpha]KAH3820999.1 hypothetical protein DPMN_122753 [Dreissena polymorpha]